MSDANLADEEVGEITALRNEVSRLRKIEDAARHLCTTEMPSGGSFTVFQEYRAAKQGLCALLQIPISADAPPAMGEEPPLVIEGAPIAGIIERCGQNPFVVYKHEEIVTYFVQQQQMTEEEAVEWIDFNIIGAWVGPATPGVLLPFHPDDYDDDS